ncbi:GntR family transcriptional regulator [Mycetocola reblochoni]|uniref:Transcriptional regulator, GntR family n=2 Tax=Mycetocola reblochoni TaxID=331618 RepID=A0A1R4IAE8_9MICO|nr:GntR family transcriptional regulator [Mycetocola reblochoni]RLP70166.1 GntR family transcriptional regulator [Mycetocola reblochoni]SJN16815.1 Transcriptional regulator, GntR family [Mycetocola reblochoni REB411]
MSRQQGASPAGIDRRGLRDRVYDMILRKLLEGEIPAGARLSIDSMAKVLNVSPTPVREALVELERTGLVTREALKGYRVAPPLNTEQLEELFQARTVLEVEAARLAGAHVPAMLPELRERQRRHSEEGDRILARGSADEPVPLQLTQDYFQSDFEFHRAVFEHSGNRYLVGMYESLGALTHRMRQAVVRGPDDVTEAAAEHLAVVLAYEAGDVDGAVEAMRAHIANVRQRSMAASGDGV